MVCSLCHCGDLFTCAFESKPLDRVAQPINGGHFIDSLAGCDQERRCLGTGRYLVGYAHCCQFLIMLESQVHIDTASLAIFDVVFIRASTLWTLNHDFLLLSGPSRC